MNQDLSALEGGVDGLIKVLEETRGDLVVRPNNFAGYSRGARFYPMLYMLMRLEGSLDWYTGAELSQSLLGKTTGLQLHHIFPKARLYEERYERHEVNALAEFHVPDTGLQSNRLRPRSIGVPDRAPQEGTIAPGVSLDPRGP